ncbi:1-deoxy-D-xylulose-5-phosphate synthase [Gilvimarinus sp. SDUM040013]|uniref:1-deoxy-D-xylulose-5-phosphate synthase n=1 Tax=Gilvimarinus gilvus TaxID=3058038 RepID=A0ABU4RX96_9GAMM|nr:1-deoxy-D-xylulose-5-phosphate synthase [Gilvimarinus sp. SDUM040013]MDO3386772.1 1-deoxy-D-xylulose-5-phosphate synthase [Gilvimarinus sp. SDUM040013]MDX6848298.1 1-deoxy-D-xylulose-5-phosphate synthase [Gilvimarinus sp. SDUM040013]
MLNEIPQTRPATPLLDRIDSPADLRELSDKELPKLAEELRAFLLYSVGQTGGHFGAGLGVVELTIALHYVYQTPVDRLVWDVGHQTYPHKILTGRREQLLTMRQADGLSGFPKREESEYDTFGVGHSSTSISAALGMALAGNDNKCAAIIGDGAMTAGMAFEALNHAAHTEADLLVILNDNNMSISPNVGGLATYLSKIWGSKFYNSLREGSKQVLTKIPSAWEFARRTEEHFKGFVSPGTLFEELGFNYIGPIDGHDMTSLVRYLRNLRDVKGPKLLHIITQKGKGFEPAEQDPVGYHALNKLEPAPKKPVPNRPKFQAVFGQWLCDMAAIEPRLVGITPAMCEGSGMVEFAEQYAERFYDVAIAEQHAVTLAAGLACEGKKPVVAIYSTFLQRAYDQLIHDVALQNLDVTFAIDRAGLVGEDGATHAGSFDISFLRCIPNMVLATPSDENECRQLLYTCFSHQGPSAVRYPRGRGPGATIEPAMNALPLGKGIIKRHGTSAALLCFGTLTANAQQAASELGLTLCDMRFVKPLDTELIGQMARSHALLVTLEENAIAGGAGSAVTEFLNTQQLNTPVLQLGLSDDFVSHASQSGQLANQGLDAAGIGCSIRQRLSQLGVHSLETRAR